jgi:hypothetical protein
MDLDEVERLVQYFVVNFEFLNDVALPDDAVAKVRAWANETLGRWSLHRAREYRSPALEKILLVLASVTLMCARNHSAAC